MAAFRGTLLVAIVAVVALTVLRLFPLALIAAACLVPLLVVVYMVDVDVYEDEPAWAIGLSVGWGAAVGVATGLLALAIAPSHVDAIRDGPSSYAVSGGIVLPLAGLALVLVGPLVLLRYPRFNDVLDGVTFGAAAAATLAGGQAITYGVSVLGGGVRPDGAVAEWVWRLLALGVAMPVLAMAVVGLACAALWLRYRAPVRDSGALGPSGRPGPAIVLAALALVAAALAETVLAAAAWLALLVVFDVAGLILLRRAIHLGLVQESREIDVGRPIECPNCHEATPLHTFCGSCGVSLQALPKRRALEGRARTSRGPRARCSGGADPWPMALPSHWRSASASRWPLRLRPAIAPRPARREGRAARRRSSP